MRSAGIGSVLCAMALVLTGCGGSDPESSASDDGNRPTETSEQQPKTVAAAKAVATEEANRYSSKDFVGAWDLWTKAGKAAISRKDYEKLSIACDRGGIPLEVSAPRLEGKESAIVRIGLGNITNAYRLLYEEGEWRWQPNHEDVANYKLGVEKAIAKLKAEGSCG